MCYQDIVIKYSTNDKWTSEEIDRLVQSMRKYKQHFTTVSTFLS